MTNIKSKTPSKTPSKPAQTIQKAQPSKAVMNRISAPKPASKPITKPSLPKTNTAPSKPTKSKTANKAVAKPKATVITQEPPMTPEIAAARRRHSILLKTKQFRELTNGPIGSSQGGNIGGGVADTYFPFMGY